jgi:DNA polymerase-4
MKAVGRGRSILHVDLDPFFVSVERSLDPGLRGVPLIVGGTPDGSGIVAAASHEAREAGVRPGQLVLQARRLCPHGVFRPGDLDTYGRVSEEVTAILLGASRRVERPSADEAYLDLTREAGGPAPVPAVEAIRDQIQRRLGLDASFGLGSSRLAARVASAWARPRGLLVVLPGYERSFLARQPVAVLPDLPPHLETALQRAGLTTLGQLLDADDETLAEAVGASVAPRLRAAALADDQEPIALTAPPTAVHEETTIRDRRSDAQALRETVGELAARACRRLRPFGLAACHLAVEVRRVDSVLRRSESPSPGLSDEETARAAASGLAAPMLEPASAVRALQVRLSRLVPEGRQAPLFPATGAHARRR